MIHGAAARVLLANGEGEAARAAFQRMQEASQRTTNTREVDGFKFVAYALASLDTAIVELADEAYLRACYRFFEASKAIPLLTAFGGCPQVIYGNIALALDEVAVAETAFTGNLTWAQREGADIIGGRCHLGLAEVASRHGQTGDALRHLDAAAALFQQHGAKLFLEQAIAKKVELQGVGSQDMGSSIVLVTNAVQAERPDLRPQAAPDGTVTLLFTDIENSTPLNERLGDARYMELLRAHNALIDEQVRLHGGRVVKTIGDGFMVAFASARRGLECAIAIQRELTASQDLDGVRVRIGLHTGEMVKQGDDFFGRHVNLAARVAAAALGGEIVVSDLVRGVVQGQEFAFDDLGERPMKGFEQPLRIWQLRWDCDSGPRHMSAIEIEIDKERQAHEVAGITGTPYFQDLRAQPKGLRQSRST